MTVDIVILTNDRPKELDKCLNSVISQNCKTKYRIIVIDNGTQNKSEKVFEKYKKNIYKIVKDKTKKLSYLFNLAWKVSKSKIIVYLADDTKVNKNWLDNLLETFKYDKKAGIVGGPTISSGKQTMHVLYELKNKNKIYNWVISFYESFLLDGKLFEPGYLAESGAYSMGGGFKPKDNKIIECDLLTTSNMAIKREVLEKIKGFDENFWFNHADGDLFIRAKKAGYKLLYNPKAWVIHYVSYGPSRYPYIIGRDTAFFFSKDIKPKTIKGKLGKVIYLTIFNLYWLYNAVKYRDIKQLKGISGFIKGLFDFLKYKLRK